MTPNQTLEQYRSKLISFHEALSILQSIEVRAAYDRDYCDTFEEYSRQQKLISDAQRYYAAIMRHIY